MSFYVKILKFMSQNSQVYVSKFSFYFPHSSIYFIVPALSSQISESSHTSLGRRALEGVSDRISRALSENVSSNNPRQLRTFDEVSFKALC